MDRMLQYDVRGEGLSLPALAASTAGDHKANLRSISIMMDVSSYRAVAFQPKEPFEGPEPFQPYLLGYVELPGEVIVETRIVDCVLEDLKLGMPMEFVVAPFDATRATYAFRPEKA
jgi:uncharacterized OB-fold protein